MIVMRPRIVAYSIGGGNIAQTRTRLTKYGQSTIAPLLLRFVFMTPA